MHSNKFIKATSNSGFWYLRKVYSGAPYNSVNVSYGISDMNLWQIGNCIYFALLAGSFWPVARALARKVKIESWWA